MHFFAHPTAVIDEGCLIGPDTGSGILVIFYPAVAADKRYTVTKKEKIAQAYYFLIKKNKGQSQRNY